MFLFKFSWICKIFGHRFLQVKDLRLSKVKRERIVYRCLRCDHPLIVRQSDRRHIDRRACQRRQANRVQSDRRHKQRRRLYNPLPDTTYLLHI